MASDSPKDSPEEPPVISWEADLENIMANSPPRVSRDLDIAECKSFLKNVEKLMSDKASFDSLWTSTKPKNDKLSAIANLNKSYNQDQVAVPYDLNRVVLKNSTRDYINATKFKTDDLAYVITQSPLKDTINDFWNMVWQENANVIVMLSPLDDNGKAKPKTTAYWPDEGMIKVENMEIHLVSEHIWNDNFVIRSLYLKNLKFGKTRTVNQLHYLTWPKDSVPASEKDVLDFRK